MTTKAHAVRGASTTVASASCLGGDNDTKQDPRRRRVTAMTTVPVLDVLLVVLEFVALFVATWVTWFVIITLYQVASRRTRARHGSLHTEARPARAA